MCCLSRVLSWKRNMQIFKDLWEGSWKWMFLNTKLVSLSSSVLFFQYNQRNKRAAYYSEQLRFSLHEMDRNTQRWVTADVPWLQSLTWSSILNMFTVDSGWVRANGLRRVRMEEGKLWHWDWKSFCFSLDAVLCGAERGRQPKTTA